MPLALLKQGLFRRRRTERVLPATPDLKQNYDIVITRAREKPSGCYAIARADSHAWFKIAGRDAVRMLAKLCGVDLRPHRFDELEIAQTIVARLPAIFVRDDIGEMLAYHLLADSASALYLWDCLVEAMAEFDNAVAGTEAFEEGR